MRRIMPQEYTRRAGLARRLAAIAYDTILVAAALLLASLPWAIAGVTPGHALYPLHVAFIYALAVLYFTWFWTHGGQTPGMKIWHLRVIGDDGEAIGWRVALVRTAAAVLSWAPLAGGFLWAIFDDRRRTWHDRLSGSRLIRIARPSGAAPGVAPGAASDAATGAAPGGTAGAEAASGEAPASEPPEAGGGEHYEGQKRP